MPPEMIDGSYTPRKTTDGRGWRLGWNDDSSIDIWSAGVVFAGLLCGDHHVVTQARPGQDQWWLVEERDREKGIEAVQSWCNGNGATRVRQVCVERGWSDEDITGAIDFMLSMLVIEPSGRSKAVDLIHHPWLSSVPRCLSRFSWYLKGEVGLIEN